MVVVVEVEFGTVFDPLLVIPEGLGVVAFTESLLPSDTLAPLGEDEA